MTNEKWKIMENEKWKMIRREHGILSGDINDS
jgi:hypothetical protein